MRDVSIFIWLLVVLLGANDSFSTTVTDCLCTNQTRELPAIKLICGDHIEEEKDPRYHSCYREIFEGNGGSGEITLQTIGCTGSTLDPRIPAAFKDLNEYDISNHSLESLQPDDLRFAELNSLYAKHNKLTFIPAGLFVHAPHLSEINLSFNDIAAVEAGAFSELENLQWLLLENNPIRHFDGKILLPIHFRISAFSITWENVDEFDISHMDGIFDLSYSPGGFFKGFAFGKGKEKLHGHSYVTKYYEADIFGNVKVFNASGTTVAGVVDLFVVFGPAIEALDVSSNTIRQFNGSAIDRFNNLQHLILSNTSLSSFDFDGIHNRAQLEVLDLSHNNLSKIEFSSSFGSFPKLKTLNLIGNKLTQIDFVTPTNFPKLTTLGISQNQFTCNYLKEFLGQWPGSISIDCN